MEKSLDACIYSALFPDEDSPVMFDNNLETMEAIKEIFTEYLKDVCKEFDIENYRSPKCYNRIRTHNIAFPVENGEFDVSHLNVINSMKTVLDKLIECDKVIPLCCVCYVKHGNMNYHIVYFVKPGARGVKSVNKIFSSLDDNLLLGSNF